MSTRDSWITNDPRVLCILIPLTLILKATPCPALFPCMEINRQIGEEARAAGIFVSVADSPEESSFYFPALCVEQGLVAGVVSETRDHKKTAAAAQAIRRLLEESM